VVPNLNGHLGHQSSNLFHYRASTSFPLHPNTHLANASTLVQAKTQRRQDTHPSAHTYRL